MGCLSIRPGDGGGFPKPQPFCLWGTAFFREQEVGGCELVVSLSFTK